MGNSERTKKSSLGRKPEEKNALVENHKAQWTANRSLSSKGMGNSKNRDRPHLLHDDRSGQPVVRDVDPREIRNGPPNTEPMEEIPAPPVGNQEPTRGSDDEGSPTKRGSNSSETKPRSNSGGLMPKKESAKQSKTLSEDEKPENKGTGGEIQDPGNSKEDSKPKDESLNSDTVTVYTPHDTNNLIKEKTAEEMNLGINATGTSSSSGQDPQDGPKSVNIVLLGETGVGKTTFINSLVNVRSHKTLGSILTAETRILVDTAFTLSDENHQIHQVKVRSNFGQNPMNEQLNDKGESATQGPVIHNILWDNAEGRTKMLNIIDTPGMSDTRGPEQDQENFEKILRCINKLGELHAICIVMKPNQARFSPSFRYNIEGFLTRLHRDAVKNILFCFTNTRSTLYRPGDTLTTLHSYLADLEKDRGVLIKADRHNICCFDNDCFRYVLAVKQGVYTRTDELDELFAESWERNAGEFQKLLARAERLPIHNVQDTLSINRTRQLVIILAKPLAEIARNHLLNMKLTEDYMNQIIHLQGQQSKLKSRIAKRVVTLESRKLLKPRTVCRSSKCTRWVKSGHQVVPEYTVCHDKCNLERSPQDGYCGAFLISKGCYGDRCQVCGCHRNYHQHEFYEIRAVTHEVEDRRTLDDFRDVAQRAADTKKLLEEEKEKLKSLEFEHDSIRDFCAEAAVFLLENAIKSKADPYLLQIQNLIRDEENKMKLGGDMETYYELEALLSQYQTRVKSLQEDIRDNRRTPVTCDELLQKMENLALQPHCGEQVKQLKALCEENLAELEQKIQEEPTTSHV